MVPPLFRKKHIKMLMTSRPKAATRTSTPQKAGDCTATSTLVGFPRISMNYFHPNLWGVPNFQAT